MRPSFNAPRRWATGTRSPRSPASRGRWCATWACARRPRSTWRSTPGRTATSASAPGAAACAPVRGLRAAPTRRRCTPCGPFMRTGVVWHGSGGCCLERNSDVARCACALCAYRLVNQMWFLCCAFARQGGSWRLCCGTAGLPGNRRALSAVRTCVWTPALFDLTFLARLLAAHASACKPARPGSWTCPTTSHECVQPLLGPDRAHRLHAACALPQLALPG